MTIHPSWYRKGSEEDQEESFRSLLVHFTLRGVLPSGSLSAARQGGLRALPPVSKGGRVGIKDISPIKTMLVEKTSPSLNSYGVRNRFDTLAGVRYHQSDRAKAGSRGRQRSSVAERALHKR